MVCVKQTRPHCVNQMGKTQSKVFAKWHGRGTAWKWHGMCESALSVLAMHDLTLPVHTVSDNKRMTPQTPRALFLIPKYLSWLSHLLMAARRATAWAASCHFPWCIALVKHSICSQKIHAWEIGSCGNLSLAFTNTWVARWYSPWNKGLPLYNTNQLYGTCKLIVSKLVKKFHALNGVPRLEIQVFQRTTV
jgi:hypothetical protein